MVANSTVVVGSLREPLLNASNKLLFIAFASFVFDKCIIRERDGEGLDKIAVCRKKLVKPERKENKAILIDAGRKITDTK